ncbi:MAG: hypothetical protein HY673_16515 [Chloroflexi bacterium]|nr:hypothetical protein [Chloroflexota bacterium]
MPKAEMLNPLTEADQTFVIEGAAPDFRDKDRLKRLINEDEAFRKGLVADEKVFKKVMADENVFLKISSALYFEVLLRRTFRELGQATHTVERAGHQTVPVFDVKEVAALLVREPVLRYLVNMLASFTRIESYAIPVRLSKGVWRKMRFNNMDIDSLSSFCESLPEEQRLGFYKRIADVCLFTLGMFPEHLSFNYRYPSSDEVHPRTPGRRRRGLEDYEEEGRRFYRLAAEHPSLKDSEAAEVFQLLHENFSAARKPLNFISDNYLHFHRQKLFGFA